MQLSSRILTALAVLILAVGVLSVRAGDSSTLDAATGTIDVVNVGTCYTTNDDVFGVDDCLDGDDAGDDAEYVVGDSKAIMEVDSVYATYAIDPKTSGDAPRAILKNADLIKISIEDKGRDKRTGVLFAVGAQTLDATIRTTIRTALGEKLSADLLVMGDYDNDPNTADTAQLQLTSESDVTFTGGAVAASGTSEFLLTGDGSNDYPMAPENDGEVYWFGTVNGEPANNVVNLKDYVTLDEDLSTGEADDLAPWMRVTVSVPEGTGGVVVQYIYYQTSEEEELVGGKKKGEYDGIAGNPAGMVSPVFVDAEARDADADQQALSLSASADGDAASQNLWLKETGRFTGVYEGYLRLTDANGAGLDDDDNRQDWGRETGPATGPGYADADGNDIAAVLGVVGGPVKVSYRDSNGDTNSIEIQIDTAPPIIELDEPVDGASSKDDSPDVFGRFTDGGSGLRADSFKLYADNSDDSNDDTPVWNFSVNESGAGERGYVCVDAKADEGDETTGCEDDTAVAGLRGHYSGYQDGPGTFGIIESGDVYHDPESSNPADSDPYKVADAEDYDDGAESGEFDAVVRIDFPPSGGNEYNNAIDIQAVVLDRAGNFGFSDSESNDPLFIHDYGTVSKERDDDDKHNVLGWYSRHVYRLDDVDPVFEADQSATGFFTDENGDRAASSSGVVVVFDGDIAAESVGTDTFAVQLDNGSDGTIVDVDVDGNNVYLLLEETLEPDETPHVELAAGKSVVDLAGNESTSRRLEGFTLNDGILPTFTVTLSGGSGLNEDIAGEGPSELTKNQMLISITSDEDIQGAPKFAVVCNGLTWGDPDDENGVATFAKNRQGPIKQGDLDEVEPLDDADDQTDPKGNTTCDADAEERAYFDVVVTSAHARRGNLWQFEWSNLSSESQKLANGKLAVIVWGRDTSSYENNAGANLHNYSSATVTFNYDTELQAAWGDGENSELVPAAGSDVFEPRPFVLLDFDDEGTTVEVTTFEVDGVDYTDDVQDLEGNEFVWWPEPLAYGKYEVYVEANDAANNTGEHTYSFTVKARASFVLDLLAGWNSVSFPANPIDRALHAVFTEEAVDQVIGWNATEPVSPWRMATRVDGVWTTNDEYATLNDVEARYGYWVHSTGFVTQAVQLAGKGDRGTDGQPNPSDIPTDEGWNFVGVVDVDGDQTQDNAGETLRNNNNDPITATEYLGNYTRAYTWDHINNTWDVVKDIDSITIGTGVWVYYTSDHDIAP